ncbi:MAG TPA: ferritin-like domain-containing protein [Trebonia sp.]|nr:ferritin-like domain-containing protein [Trebonia sp.]
MATTPVSTDQIAVLQGALAAEYAAIYGYGVVGAYLSGKEQGDAMSDWQLHQDARDTLSQMIGKLGGTPVASSAAYDLPFTVDSVTTARRLAAVIEEGVTRAYLGVVAVGNAKLRTFGALAMQGPANRAIAWGGTPTAFPGMTSAPAGAATDR